MTDPPPRCAEYGDCVPPHNRKGTFEAAVPRPLSGNRWLDGPVCGPPNSSAHSWLRCWSSYSPDTHKSQTWATPPLSYLFPDRCSTLAFCCQRSDLAPDTPRKPTLSRETCPDPEEIDREHLAGSQGTSPPTSPPGMGQLQGPCLPNSYARLPGSGQRSRGRGKQVQAQERAAIRSEGPPELYLATLPRGSSGPTQLLLPLQLLLQLGTP